jgi:hypothetical protein
MDIETILIIVAGVMAVVALVMFITYKYLLYKKVQEAIYG